MIITFAVTETGPNSAAGDYFTALELGCTLTQRYGWLVHYIPEPDWYKPIQTNILIIMLDHFDLTQLPSRSNIMTIAWARNWFDRWAQRPWLKDYDMLLSSSQKGSQVISEQAKKLCGLFRIATNPNRFNYALHALNPTFDYVFTGSNWGASREIVNALSHMPKALRGALYGKNWQDHKELKHLYKGFVSYDQLPNIYYQSRNVIDDANHVIKTWGAANSRVFDALAAGCLVITNSQSVSDEVFDGLLPVYQSPEHLCELALYYTNNLEVCQSLQIKLRNIVIKQHCYRHRAYEFKLNLPNAYVSSQGII